MAQVTGGAGQGGVGEQNGTGQPLPQGATGPVANNPSMRDGAVSASAMQGNSMGSAQDKKFAKMAMTGDMTEIQAAQLALSKSSSADVKQFAQKMIDDHTTLDNQMKPVAAQLGLQPPTTLMPKQEAMLSKLQPLQGDAFDKAYIKAMLKDHQEDDKAFMMEASSGSYPQEKQLAQQGDPIIKQHLEMVQNLAKAHNVM
jgi:putative membrane protein